MWSKSFGTNGFWKKKYPDVYWSNGAVPCAVPSTPPLRVSSVISDADPYAPPGEISAVKLPSVSASMSSLNFFRRFHQHVVFHEIAGDSHFHVPVGAADATQATC